jgi:hypothetical protein
MKRPRCRFLLLALLLAVCLPGVPGFAALSVGDVWEVRAATGNDNNGGAFKIGATGTDRSQQNAAQVVIDNAVITTSITANVITFTGYVPTAADVGNVVHMLTGTNVTAGFYEITAQSATTWTVTGGVALPTSGTTTNATGNMGGALATLGTLSGAMVGSNRAYVTGSFTSTTTTTFAQNVSTPTTATPYTRLIGYGAARGDAGTATLTLSTNTGLTGIAITASGFSIEQIVIDCATLGTSTGISLAAASQQPRVRNCKISNFTVNGILTSSSNYQLIEDNEITGGTAAATAAISMGAGIGAIMRCYIHDNTCSGIILGTCQGGFFYNIIANNLGATSDGVSCTHGQQIENNTIHGNGRDGIHNTGSNNFGGMWRDNLLTSNGVSAAGYGLNNSGGSLPAEPEFDGNAYWNNATGARNNADNVTGVYAYLPYTNSRDQILTANPYVGPTSGGSANFSLNNVPGGGRSCRGAGTPGAFPGLTATVGFEDLGAVQTRGGITRNPPMARPPVPKKPARKPVRQKVAPLISK